LPVLLDVINGKTPMKFLDGPSTEIEIRNLWSTAKTARVAVAGWGEGAVERLGLERMVGRDIQIVCDLLSGACNPVEIKLLRELLGNERVLTCRRLHAKVWCTDQGAIIGSSNASANGLGAEDKQASKSIEANILVHEGAIIEAIEYWYRMEVARQARKIGDDDLKLAQKRWEERQRIQPPPEGASLLDVISKDPSAFGNDRDDLLVWVWKQDERDDWAERALEEERRLLDDRGIDCWQDVRVEAMPPAGAHVLEFDIPRAKAKFTGLWRVLADHPVLRKKQGTLLLCTRVQTMQGLPLGDRAVWQDAATRAAQSEPSGEWEGNLERFAQNFLMPSITA
jgi:hypothetical protein